MAEIVDLAAERGFRPHRERACEPHLGPAQVVLYTGIRYERALPPPASKKPKRKPRKPKN